MATREAEYERTGASGQRSETLALLYQGLLTGIVRIQAGRQQLSDSNVFRRRMKVALREVQQPAALAGYSPEDISLAEFAVVAFLDEAILSSKDPSREQWRQQTLNLDLYGQQGGAVAGEMFFDRLAEIRKRPGSPQQADLLEVYLLCLLLGFEGRYAGPLKGEAYLIASELKSRIDSIRSADYRFSPPLQLAQNHPDPHLEPPSEQRWIWLAAAPLVLSIGLFVVYKIHLIWQVKQTAALLASLK